MHTDLRSGHIVVKLEKSDVKIRGKCENFLVFLEFSILLFENCIYQSHKIVKLKLKKKK